MRDALLPLALSVAVVAGCAAVPPPLVGAPAPDAVVADIAKQFSACNLDALAEHYAASAEFVSPSTPKPIVGRTAIRDYFAGACSGAVRPLMRVQAQRVRLLATGAAVVSGSYSFGRTDRPNDAPWPAWFVITLEQDREGRWLITTQATFAVPGG